jgi:hypothetical protein
MVHDMDLPLGVQCTSVRLMLNLVEVLMNGTRRNTGNQTTTEQYRQLLQQILYTLIAKLSTMEKQMPKLIQAGMRPGHVVLLCGSDSLASETGGEQLGFEISQGRFT